MQDSNGRTALRTLVQFEAPSYVPLSLSADKRWLAYGDEESGSIFIGKWKNRSPHLSDVQQGPDLANLRALEWSPDSKRLLAISNATAFLLEPNSLESAKSFKEFEEIGIAAALWSYDSTFVIFIDPFCTSTAIFGIDESVHWLAGVRMVNNKPLLALRPDNKALAIWAFQADIGEALMVYSCADWSSILVIRPNCVLVSGIRWFPNSGALLVWDSIARNRVECFHLDGSVRHIISPADITEEGVRSLAVSPCCSLIAIFNNNLNIHVFNTLSWRPVSLFELHNFTETPVGSHWTPFMNWSTCGEYLAFSSTSSSRLCIWSSALEDTFHFDFAASISHPIWKVGFSLGALTIIICAADMSWHPKKPTIVVATESHEVWLLKSPGSEREVGGVVINACKLASDRKIPLREIQWVGINPTYLVVRSKSSYVAVTSVR